MSVLPERDSSSLLINPKSLIWGRGGQKNLWTCFPFFFLAEEGVSGKIWIHVIHGWGSEAAAARPGGLLSPSSHAENSPPTSRPEGEGLSRPAVMLLGFRCSCSSWGCKSEAGMKAILCLVKGLVSFLPNYRRKSWGGQPRWPLSCHLCLVISFRVCSPGFPAAREPILL